MRSLAALTMLVLIGGCFYTSPIFSPKPWDKFADGPPMQVYGSDPGSDGKAIFAALKDEPDVGPFLAREGEPDTLQIVGGRFDAKQVILMYTRRGAGSPRRVVLYPTADGLIPRAPEPLAIETPTPTRTRPARRRSPRPQAMATPAAMPVPSAVQRLECPIDPSRPDCQALCVPGATFEWCR